MGTELQPGDPARIGPYRLLAVLGNGGMGRVYLGRSPGGRQVAVKVIRAQLATDQEFRIRFRREVAAARRVNGIYTAAVVDADTEGPVPWLATAYISAPSLADAVQQGAPLPPDALLPFAAALAEGLSAIHAAGLVHRDLKPSNVLLAPDGPRVIDFGIAYAAEATSLTETNAVIGSPGYLSPEQAEAEREVAAASDVFSLGAVLCFAATGHSPWGTGSSAALLYRVVHGEPGIADVPAEIRSLVARCLAKVPGQRPSAAGILAELGDPVPTGGWPAGSARDTASMPTPVSAAEAVPTPTPESAPSPAPAMSAAADRGTEPAHPAGPGLTAPGLGRASKQEVPVVRPAPVAASSARPPAAPPTVNRPAVGRSAADRLAADRPAGGRPAADPAVDHPAVGRPQTDPAMNRPATGPAADPPAGGVPAGDGAVGDAAGIRVGGPGRRRRRRVAWLAGAAVVAAAAIAVLLVTQALPDQGSNGPSTPPPSLVGVYSGSGYEFNAPNAIAADGQYVWVLNGGNDSVSQLDARTGAPLRVLNAAGYGFKYTAQDSPTGIIDDGANVWVGNHDSVTEINAATGALVRHVEPPASANYYGWNTALARAGSQLWAALPDTCRPYCTGGAGSGFFVTLIEYNASTGRYVRAITRDTIQDPVATATDGADIWLVGSIINGDNGADSTAGSVTEFNATSGRQAWSVPATINYSPSATNYDSVAYDDGHLWIANGETVTELNASDGQQVKVLSGAQYKFSQPAIVVAAGAHVLVANRGGNSVSEINASTGALEYTLTAARYHFNGLAGITVAGNRVWVLNTGSVTELAL